MTSAPSGRLRFVLLLLAVLLVGMAAPTVAGTIAARARNADKVDGLSAVKAKASVKKRRGRLVATDKKTGLLPSDIIAEAPDADRLDGLDSASFVQGATVRHVVATCPGVGFQPDDGSAFGTVSGVRYSSAVTPLDCPIDLPASALIRSVTFTVFDNDGAHNASCALDRQSVVGGFASLKQVASVVTSGASSAFQVLSTSTVIENNVTPERTYFLTCSLGVNQLDAVSSGQVAYDITENGSMPPQ